MAPATATCGQTVSIVGTITTNGGVGTISYRWARTDGADTDLQSLNATAGETRYSAVFQWSLQGRGQLNAVATLIVVHPDGVPTAAARVLYTC